MTPTEELLVKADAILQEFQTTPNYFASGYDGARKAAWAIRALVGVLQAACIQQREMVAVTEKLRGILADL